VAQTAGVLKEAGYSIDDLRSFWTWWHKNDWRGQKGQLPTLPQLRSEIGKIRLPVVTTPSNGANGNGIAHGASKVEKSLANAAALRDKLARGGTL